MSLATLPRREAIGSKIALHIVVALVVAALAVGFAARTREAITPREGVGYWLGIAGAAMMAALFAYALRKRFMARGHAAAVLPKWFRLHVTLGIVGPALILFHCNFRLGGPNSNVALFTMILVVASGLAGRYLYRHAHRSPRVAQLVALWRLLHAPLCAVLLVATLAHIWAVHRF